MVRLLSTLMVIIIASCAAFAVRPGQAHEHAPAQKEPAAVQASNDPAEAILFDGEYGA